jgi:hypothetical protein
VAGSFTEVGSDCLSMSITRERADAFDGLAAGQATLIVDNADSRWSPEFTGGPYAPHLKPAKKVRIGVTPLWHPILTSSPGGINYQITVTDVGALVTASTALPSSTVPILQSAGGSRFVVGVGDTGALLTTLVATAVTSIPNLQSPSGLLFQLAVTDAGALNTTSLQAATYRLFTGFIDSLGVSPQLGRREATIRASDRMRKLDRRVLTIGSVRADINVGSVWTEVLSLLRVDTRSIDRLFDTLPFYWKENERGKGPLDELLAITHGYAYVAGDDVFHVKERYWPVRQTGPVGSHVNEALDLTYTLAENQIINRATVRSRPRRKASTVQSVAWLDQVVFIPPSGSVSFELAYRDPATQERDTPATEMATPVNGTDYLTNTSSAGDGTDLTAATSAQVTFKSVSAVCSVFNGDGRGAHLTRFVLRGKSLQRQPEVEAVTEDSSSQAVYDVREFTLANDLIGSIGFARDYSGFLVQERKEPLGDITLRLKNVFPDVLQTEIGDLLHVTESHAAIGSQWVVTGLTHTIRLERGLEHEVEYALEFFRDPEWLILDDPVKGKLDFRRLGF